MSRGFYAHTYWQHLELNMEQIGKEQENSLHKYKILSYFDIVNQIASLIVAITLKLKWDKSLK